MEITKKLTLCGFINVIFSLPVFILGVELLNLHIYVPLIIQAIILFLCGLGLLVTTIVVFLTDPPYPEKRIFVYWMFDYSTTFKRVAIYAVGFSFSFLAFILAVSKLL